MEYLISQFFHSSFIFAESFHRFSTASLFRFNFALQLTNLKQIIIDVIPNFTCDKICEGSMCVFHKAICTVLFRHLILYFDASIYLITEMIYIKPWFVFTKNSLRLTFYFLCVTSRTKHKCFSSRPSSVRWIIQSLHPVFKTLIILMSLFICKIIQLSL